MLRRYELNIFHDVGMTINTDAICFTRIILNNKFLDRLLGLTLKLYRTTSAHKLFRYIATDVAALLRINMEQHNFDLLQCPFSNIESNVYHQPTISMTNQ